jgi:hypothetical protein
MGGLVTALGCLFTSFASQFHQLFFSYGIMIGGLVWYGMVIYSGLIFIVHILLIFFIDMSLNILNFSLNFSLHYLQTFGSGGMSDIHLNQTNTGCKVKGLWVHWRGG